MLSRGCGPWMEPTFPKTDHHIIVNYCIPLFLLYINLSSHMKHNTPAYRNAHPALLMTTCIINAIVARIGRMTQHTRCLAFKG
jgi:hypothetical protein